MSKRSKLDIALVRMGYVAAFFILIITAGAIIVAIINMYKSGKIPELPQGKISALDADSSLPAPERPLLEAKEPDRNKS